MAVSSSSQVAVIPLCDDYFKKKVDNSLNKNWNDAQGGRRFFSPAKNQLCQSQQDQWLSEKLICILQPSTLCVFCENGPEGFVVEEGSTAGPFLLSLLLFLPL